MKTDVEYYTDIFIEFLICDERFISKFCADCEVQYYDYSCEVYDCPSGGDVSSKSCPRHHMYDNVLATVEETIEEILILADGTRTKEEFIGF